VAAADDAITTMIIIISRHRESNNMWPRGKSPAAVLLTRHAVRHVRYAITRRYRRSPASGRGGGRSCASRRARHRYGSSSSSSSRRRVVVRQHPARAPPPARRAAAVAAAATRAASRGRRGAAAWRPLRLATMVVRRGGYCRPAGGWRCRQTRSPPPPPHQGTTGTARRRVPRVPHYRQSFAYRRRCRPPVARRRRRRPSVRPVDGRLVSSHRHRKYTHTRAPVPFTRCRRRYLK